MKLNPPLLALAIGAFGIGVTEFAPMGMLPVMATDLGVSIPTAGLLVSAYAVGVVLGAPLMTLTTTRVPRRTLPVLLMARMVLPGLGGVIAPVVLAILSIAGSLMVERIAIAAGAGWLYARPGWASAVAARHMMEQLPRLAAQWVRPAV